MKNLFQLVAIAAVASLTALPATADGRHPGQGQKAQGHKAQGHKAQGPVAKNRYSNRAGRRPAQPNHWIGDGHGHKPKHWIGDGHGQKPKH